MNLIQMSISGGILILAVIVVRALALHRLPKGTFLALWAVAALRLLLPFSIPSPASVYSLVDRAPVRAEAPAGLGLTEAPVPPEAVFSPGAVQAAEKEVSALAPAPESTAGVWMWLWLAGAALCGAYFLAAGLRCRREFGTALPVEDAGLQGWLASRRLRRTVALRQSDRTGAPLTYGLLRPVILLPKSWTGGERLDWALEHELAHIRHLDALWKPLLVFTACVHWFNPLVWCMLALANRDMELRCDEAAVRRMGLDRRSAYALALISMEEKKSGLSPFASAFSKNAIEERIVAIMKIKKRSLTAILAAAALVCCVGVGFATSAAARPDTPYPSVQDGTFTRKELSRLASLWFEGYEDMTVAEYQQKMWAERDRAEDIALIDRYAKSALSAAGGPFEEYFYNVYEPLTARSWQERTFSGEARVRTEDGSPGMVEYDITMRVLDPDTLTVGEYQRRLDGTRASMERIKMQPLILLEAEGQGIYGMMSSPASQDDALEVTVSYVFRSLPDDGQPTDAELYARISSEIAAQWDEILSVYVPFGLTYQFDDPDLDGNGLTMWFQGREVRGICDEAAGVWITEHTGNSAYAEDAVELYAVYTDGVLSGLRFAAPEEQAEWDGQRENSAAARPSAAEAGEEREFPRATEEDYDALLALRTVEYADLPSWASYPYPDARDLSLEDFNRRLLDWANEDADGVLDRIICDVIWNDYGVELTTDERQFVAVTCLLSVRENAAMIRALHTGEPERDPSFSANMPERAAEENGIRTAWCNLYYNVSYHVADKSAVTARERDACVGGMMNAVNVFWRDTDFETLLQMTGEDAAAQFNAWAAENSTENVRINPITADDIFFEPYDERGVN